MNISGSLLNWYKKLKQILEDSNIALVNRGLNSVSNLLQIPSEIEKLGEINRLPYLLGKNIIDITENDLSGVTKLGESVLAPFYNCSHLKKIEIPNSVTAINPIIFENRNCPVIDELVISMKEIPADSFKEATSLKKITLKEGVESIGSYAFSGCTSLNTINFPNSLKVLGEGACSGTEWYNCKSDGLIIHDNWIYGFKGIMPSNYTLFIESDIKGIGDDIKKQISITSCEVSLDNKFFLSENSTLFSKNKDILIKFFTTNSAITYTIPDSVINIDKHAFRYSRLINITIPDSVATIGDYAFYGCSSLTSVTIPDSMISIGSSAFAYCTSLISATIGDNVTTIGNSAFNGCDKLTNIYLNPITPPSLHATYAIPDHTIIHVPVGSGDAYRNATNWSYHATRIIEDEKIKEVK